MKIFGFARLSAFVLGYLIAMVFFIRDYKQDSNIHQKTYLKRLVITIIFAVTLLYCRLTSLLLLHKTGQLTFLLFLTLIVLLLLVPLSLWVFLKANVRKDKRKSLGSFQYERYSILKQVSIYSLMFGHYFELLINYVLTTIDLIDNQRRNWYVVITIIIFVIQFIALGITLFDITTSQIKRRNYTSSS
jgi:hypothetical protein